MTYPEQNPLDDIGSVRRCGTCGSERVVRDAWACWNPESGLWELESVNEDAHCHNCESKTKLVWKQADYPPHVRVRELNDRFRSEGRGRGSIVVTQGIQSMGCDATREIFAAVRSFDAFTDDNDPWGEHDFGAFEYKGDKVFFKFDYYDPTLAAGSENPANEGVTHRVLTIMLASEY